VVLSWLAEEREPVGFAELVAELGPLVGRAAVVEAVEALARRSLLVPRGRGTLTLPPVVLEYATAQLVDRGDAAGQVGAAAGVRQGRRAAQPGASGRAAAARARRGGREQQCYGPGGVANLPHVRGNLRGYRPPQAC
jgi:hypothetical protein